ncbi:hypothetical protein Tco_1539164 [Tanacetum coccineum]
MGGTGYCMSGQIVIHVSHQELVSSVLIVSQNCVLSDDEASRAYHVLSVRDHGYMDERGVLHDLCVSTGVGFSSSFTADFYRRCQRACVGFTERVQRIENRCTVESSYQCSLLRDCDGETHTCITRDYTAVDGLWRLYGL